MELQKIIHKINFKTKPLNSLGKLEEIAMKICTIQDTLSPVLQKPTILVFSGDHGIANEGVSAYPQSVTYQMVYNFLRGGAAINIFCIENQINLKIIDSGVNYEFGEENSLIHAKVGMGTKSFLSNQAMSDTELKICFEYGEKFVNNEFQNGCNISGFGEMGIGNTSSASIIMSYLTGLEIESCTGKGTGLMEDGLRKKIEILKKSKEFHGNITEPLSVLQTFGGYEIAQIVFAILAARKKNMILLIDGFISSTAFLVACKIDPTCLENAFFCHLSGEKGHSLLLKYLGVEPILDLNMRLGEGTGCALAYPIIKNSVAFINNMASFESAGISKSAI